MVVKSGDYSEPTSLNADFSRRAVVDTTQLPWLPSPQAGVERRLLDRVGTEVARATSIVRYAPDSQFPPHEHGAGEEFLVLEGTFCDEHGEYPAGFYVRNPPGSRHAPFTREGCVIFVKLRQMQSSGEPHIVLDTSALAWQGGGTPGHEEKLLFDGGRDGERVTLERLANGVALPANPRGGGEELLVLDGTLVDAGHEYGRGTWLRIPPTHQHALRAGEGCECWIKRHGVGPTSRRPSG